jgi:hypothetical protein
MAKKRFGVMACEGQNCESHSRHAPVVVFQNERGTLSYSCDWCGRSPYARPGTGQHDEWIEAIEPFVKKPIPAAVEKLGGVPDTVVNAPPPKPIKRTGLLMGAQ